LKGGRSDERDLNFAKYLDEGLPSVAAYDDYTSHNARRLDKGEVVDLLLGLAFVREQLHA